jgi:hypothetical protein
MKAANPPKEFEVNEGDMIALFDSRILSIDPFVDPVTPEEKARSDAEARKWFEAFDARLRKNRRRARMRNFGRKIARAIYEIFVVYVGVSMVVLVAAALKSLK